MKLTALLEFEIPLTIVSLRGWPSPTKGTQHSGIKNMKVDPITHKVKLPNRRKAKPFFKDVK